MDDLESIMLPFVLIIWGLIIACHILIYILKRRRNK